MSKTFKVVCIEDGGSNFLKQGKVFNACKAVNFPSQRWDICTEHGKENYGYNKTNFLRLPTEPKTCADMTMEEYLAMVCLRAVSPANVEWFDGASPVGFFKPCLQIGMSHKTQTRTLYQVKSAKDIEIERIEKEMRKLADDLAKIKEK